MCELDPDFADACQYIVSCIAGDEKVVTRALRGVRAVICPGRLGVVPQTAAQQGAEHIVLLSSAGRCHYCLPMQTIFCANAMPSRCLRNLYQTHHCFADALTFFVTMQTVTMFTAIFANCNLHL